MQDKNKELLSVYQKALKSWQNHIDILQQENIKKEEKAFYQE